ERENARAQCMLPPLLGERAGVRVIFSSDLIFGVGGGFWREKLFRLVTSAATALATILELTLGQWFRIGLAKMSDPKILRAMTKRQKATSEPLFLGIECGGTRSTFVITEDEPTFYWPGRV